MAVGRDYVKRIKGILLTVGILVLGGIIVIFAAHRQKALPDQARITAEKKTATVALEGVHHQHTDITNGSKDWLLDAESAEYRLEENEAFLNIINVTFVGSSGDKVFLSAESGTWHTDSNDLEVSGNVMLKNKQYEMEAETLSYISAKRMFETYSPVTIHGQALDQKADGMKYFLDSERISLEGKVEAEIGRNIEF